MDADDIETSSFNALDTAFHVRIAEATGNTLTAQLMGSLRVAINRQMVEAYAGLDDWRATAAIVRSEHRGILESIEAGRSDEAARLVKAHIESFYRVGRVGGFLPER
jgi:DNA-binding FadR family transcriptional regulator